MCVITKFCFKKTDKLKYKLLNIETPQDNYVNIGVYDHADSFLCTCVDFLWLTLSVS